MRVGFVTCVQLGLACMREIYRVGGHLDFALTLLDEQARAKSGRVYLDEFCAQRRIPLFKARHINLPESVAAIRAADLDWLFIIGWSQIAGPEVLRSTRNGVLGIHPTLLPEGRGRAAVPWAILKGLRETGVTLFQLDEGVDTGPVVAQERIPIAPDETATQLYAKVEAAHTALIGHIWTDLVAGRLRLTPQDESKATYWPGRTPEDGRITSAMSVAEVERLVRAVTRPYPGAFIDMDGRRLRIWAGRIAEASTPGALRLADGYYLPTESAWEPLPAAASQS